MRLSTKFSLHVKVLSPGSNVSMAAGIRYSSVNVSVLLQQGAEPYGVLLLEWPLRVQQGMPVVLLVR